MIISKINNNESNIVYVLCLGNINIQDTTLFHIIQPQPIAINIINPLVFKINIKIAYNDYHGKQLNIDKPVMINNTYKEKALNDLTYIYRNLYARYQKDYNKLLTELFKVIQKLDNEKMVLIIVYDNYISITEKRLLQTLLKKHLDDIKSLKLKSLIFHNNMEDYYYSVKLNDKISTANINHILDFHIEQKHKLQKYSVTSEIPVKKIKLSKVTSVITDLDYLPKQKRSELYDKLTDMIIDIFTTLGFKIENIKFENINNVADIEGSIIRRYYIDFILPDGSKDHITFDVPEMVGDSYFYLNGTRRALQYQLINNPIIVVSPGKVKLHTLYSSVTIEKTGKKQPTYKAYAGGLIMNPLLIFISQNRVNEFAKLFGYETEFSESR